MVFDLICLGGALVAFLFACRCYYELWKWARECQYWRIAIEFKGKTKIDAPLQEWLLWSRQANKDKTAGGRIVYHAGGTRVGLITRGAAKANFDFRQFRREVWKWALQRKPKIAMPTREGKWTAKDETPEENKAVTVHKIRG